ncbi:MAG: replicative DNA helicase [candidate division Zixibacteria bacterium]|nr:replicative DNA helicase [candidate division Zixibacteria bacterium]
MNVIQSDLDRAMEAEKAVLGALIRYHDNQELFVSVVEHLNGPDLFGLEIHRIIYKAILDLSGDGLPIDPISLKDWLISNGSFDRIGSMTALTDLIDWASMPTQVSHHVKLILNSAIRRKTEFFAKSLVNVCADPTKNVNEILLSAEKGLVGLSNLSRGDNIYHISEVLPEISQDFKKRQAGDVSGLLTGYSDLDKLTDGLHPGELIILAARPSIGKSAFALNIAENLIERDVTVGLISLEMTKLENTKRLVLSNAKTSIPGKNSSHRDDDFKRIDNTIKALNEVPFYVNDNPDMNVMQLRSIATKMRLNYKMELLIVDYLQLLSSGQKRTTQNEEISIISRSLKILAGELHIPIIALSQLSRAFEARGKNAKPRLSDLRDSGAIEQDADLVLFLCLDNDVKNGGELIIAKQRNGPRGKVKLLFIPEYVRWELRSRED